MTTNGPDTTDRAVPFHRHSGVNSLFGVMLVIIAVMSLIAAITGGGPDSSVASDRPPIPVLTPKDDLPVVKAVEGEHWSHAPKTPAPISRDGQVKLVVEWRATEFVGTLDPADSLRYAYWGFEGSVPGPVLRARQGDLIEVRLTNDLGNQHPHNIDFHFATGPGGGAEALNVAPGQTAVVEMRALAPGIYMYHCATPDIPTHIANGMYGFVIIEPEDGLPAVDQEFYVVQSEFYPRRSANGPATLSVSKLDAEEPDYVVFNGAVGSLTGDNALNAQVGDRVRIWFGNAGPQLISSFHVIGEIFDSVWREGSLASTPAFGVQTTLVPAGGATVVDLTLEVPGTYLLVDHAIARAAHKGAIGALVVEGAENPEIYAPGPQPSSTPAHEHSPEPDEAAMVSIPEGAFDPDNADRAFDPLNIEIETDTTVTWTNDDSVAHTVTADDGSFDSGFVSQGETWSMRFDEPGTYAYHCTPHPWMKGTVVVT